MVLAVAGTTLAHSGTAVERDEAALIQSVRAGQNELFHELIRPYERGIYLTAFSILRNQADAEEIAQEAAQSLRAFGSTAVGREVQKLSASHNRERISGSRARERISPSRSCRISSALSALTSMSLGARSWNLGGTTSTLLRSEGTVSAERLLSRESMVNHE
jgi:hypothetical protein